jgi:formylglycine-generating enzyme required for sulfatase activity
MIAGIAWALGVLLDMISVPVSTPTVVRVQPAQMLWVPPGAFTFGASPDEQAAALAMCKKGLGELERACSDSMFTNEGPARQVFLPGFWLDRAEVTVGDYRRCVAAGRCDPRPLLLSDPRVVDAALPVSNVTWFDADRYCAFAGAALPTELQWERAARGKTARLFPWGNAPAEDRSNHGRFQIVDPTGPVPRPMFALDERDGYAFLAPSGAYPAGASPDGFVDMAGNLMEWVRDAVGDDGPARTSAQKAALGLGARRMLRGGSFRQPLLYQRTTAWDAEPPDLRSPEVGFRCAKERVIERR